ncbi:hypothetical protein FOL47_000356 [Perkinsus chesapeaki]|uniref:Uncharacterized protein n=1 Tax=Perkinsus chesapeaki TaxID=330153 RepID=A0A7J6KWK6_PERCH|nr:hypothetical protein FOL47_000356 [Perkinsus chesapeaki]
MATPVGSPPIPSTAAATSAPPVDLRGLRRELASVRRSLAQARESLNNLIDDGSEDYLPVLEELHEREATSLARIAELETDIVEAQATLDASHSDRSRQAGLSRATRALGVLGEHVSGSVQQNTEPRVSPHQSVQYMSLSPSNAEDPEDPGSRVPTRANDLVIRLTFPEQASWAEQDASVLFARSKAIEKRAIGRLILAISDEIKFLRRYATVTVLHVKGSLNVEADRLSRLFDRQVGVNLPLAEALAGAVDSEAVLWPVDDDDEESEDSLSWLVEEYDDHAAKASLERSQLFSSVECENTGPDLCADLLALVPSDSSSSSLAETIAQQCYDLPQVCRTVKCMKFVFELLKANRDGEDALKSLVYPLVPDTSDFRALVYSAQIHDDACLKMVRDGVTPSGPYVLADGELVVFRTGTPFGTELRQYVLPRSAVSLRKKVLLDAHNRCGHQGLRPSLSYVEDFHLPSDLSAKCPYYKVAIDYYAVGDKVKLLSAMCCFSKHISFFRVESENSEEALRVLKLLQLRTGGVRVICSDRASYFRSLSNFRDRAAAMLNASVELTASRSPWELGSEKLHDLAGDRLRVMLRGSAGRWPDDPVREQQLLEELMLLLNTRPLRTYYVSENGSDVITPDSLCYGRTRRFGCLDIDQSLNDPGFFANFLPYRVKAIRNSFVSWLWSELKRYSLSSVRAKSRGVTPTEFAPGDAVLVYMSGRKLGMSFRLGHIVECVSDRRVRVRFPSGLVTLENLYNIVLLRAHSHRDPDLSTVSRVGMGIILDYGSYEREAEICFDPCDDSGEVWVKFKNGDVPEIVNLSSRVWRSAPISPSDGPRQGGRDSTADPYANILPSLVDMRLSVLYDVVVPNRKRPQKRYYKGKVVAVRASGHVDVEWDDAHSGISTLDLSLITYHAIH